MIDAGINLDKVDVGQRNAVAAGVDRPFDAESRAVVGIGPVVGISPVAGIQHVVVSVSAFVHIIIGQFRSLKREHIAFDPKRIIRLRVIGVAVEIPFAMSVGSPADVGAVVDIGIIRVGVGRFVFVGFVVGDAVIVNGLRTVVFAACEFIPRVVGQSVAVDVA